MVKFSKTVGLTDIGVTIAMQWWRHAFYISPIFSKSRPKLLKWCYVPGRLYIGLFDWKVLKKSMRAFSNKIRLNIFCEKRKDLLCFLLIHQDHFFPVWLRRPFYYVLNMYHRTTYYESLIQFASLDFCWGSHDNVLILFILRKRVPYLLQKVQLKNYSMNFFLNLSIWSSPRATSSP